MAIANGSFESEGASPGAASGWVSTYVSSLEQWADFDQNPTDTFTRPHEDFESGWTPPDDQAWIGAFLGDTIDIEAAIFNVGPGQTPYEHFERAWPEPADIFIPALSAIEVALFDGETVEDFEDGWGTIDLAMGATTAALFDAETAEDFEEGWGTFSEDIADFSPVAAVFDGSNPEPVEDFEESVAPAEFTATLGSDTLTLASSPSPILVNGQKVYVENLDGELPSPLQADVQYFLVGVSGSSFKLASSFNGTALDLTNDGTGTQRLLRDPSLWWSRIMTTV